ncbi:alpha/beta fold hydrolase [Enemella sp. A6]|uniref:alpha/beta fold hydrolase n=1 Tax=Enemella sp. A6 TaxID=3440152 RepID=UPI003EB82055
MSNVRRRGTDRAEKLRKQPRRDRGRKRIQLPGVLGVAASALALAAGGVAAGFELERRIVRNRFRPTPGALESSVRPGSLRSSGPTVRTPDGVDLHVEVDEPADHEPVDPDAPVYGDDITIVFVHGYALDLDCWHYQRLHFRGRARLVLYDQRSHGRSSRSAAELCRIPQLGKDLKQVLDEVVPTGPVVLLGHSMGGMTIMHLARTHPELFESRVLGVGLVHTSAGELGSVSPLRGVDAQVLAKVIPPTLAGLNRVPSLVNRAWGAGSDLGYAATRQFGFGADVPVEKVAFVSDMLSSTPLDVAADFYPVAFAEVDEYASFEVLSRVETAVIGGMDDLFTPASHTERIIELLPGADSLLLENCGHLGMIEYPELQNRVLEHLVERVVRHL